jgi:hypothetical protein
VGYHRFRNIGCEIESGESTKCQIRKDQTDAHAVSYLGFAKQYHQAANQLLDLHATDGLLRDPIYFLYFHTVEMALKAFLRAHNVPIIGTQRAREKGHSLTKLYEECRRLGLKIGPDDRFGIANIVNLLDSGNKYQGFRYFTLESGGLPDLSWTRKVVAQLMDAVGHRWSFAPEWMEST